jgi:hypothetical protein
MSLIQVIALIGSPSAAGLVSLVLERSRRFQALSPIGKLMINTTISLTLGMSSVAAMQYAVAHPGVQAALQPYLNQLVPVLSVAANQLVHMLDDGRALAPAGVGGRDAECR